MNTCLEAHDADLVGRLRRLDAVAADAPPPFDYAGLLERRSAARANARRRQSLARGTAGAVVLAMVTLSAWRLTPREEPAAIAPLEEVRTELPDSTPRLVRADTYLALAAIEDHIASIDDALTDARLLAPRGEHVARLERTRAELMDSYARVRYAEMVSNNF